MNQERLKRHQRSIIKRIIIRGLLVLETPTCLGSGDTDSPTDFALIRDSISDHALLTGASIAGALRNYLLEYEHGYNTKEQNNDLATTLLGGSRRDQNGEQSPLIVNDAISSKIPSIELRDGVAIESTTGTAKEGQKYDLELLAAGTTFPISFELLIEKDADETQLKKALALALRGLETGEISMGMKKRRGFGRCRVEKWQVWQFDLRKDKDRKEWLKFDHWTKEISNTIKSFSSIVEALGGVSLKQQIDQRKTFVIHAIFKLATPLLIRSGQNLVQENKLPDVVHLHSQRNGKNQPIISGTSLAGVLRHRAERIINTLDKNLQILDKILGYVKDNKAINSRLSVHESVIESTEELVQTRIAIDRFTGGAYHGALFSEQPVFGVELVEKEKIGKKDKYKNKPKPKSQHKHVELQLELRNPEEFEVGLLLLLLKDLWTGDLPIGGTSSIGRGRLQGVEATITWKQPEILGKKWVIYQDNGKLKFEGEDKQELESFVQKFVEKI